MKTASLMFLALLLTVSAALAQGTLQYDQQSLGYAIPPNILWTIQSNEPIGQSFIPTLSSVGFVQLELFDGHPNNGQGATLYVNLRSDSITGPVVKSSDPVFLPDIPSGGGVTNFLFSAAAPVTPGTSYFFEVVVQSGDTWRVNTLGADDYSRGTAYFQGTSQPLDDIWFREGVVAPEPSAAWLFFVGVGIWVCARRKAPSDPVSFR